MKLSSTALSLFTALALVSAPLAGASARDWDHHDRGGHGGWDHHDRGDHGGGWDRDRGGRGGWDHHGHGDGFVIGAGAALVGAAFALAAAPFQIVGSAVAPAPVYQPAPVAYGYPGYYYAYPRQRVVVSYPQPVYAAPGYYAPY